MEQLHFGICELGNCTCSVPLKKYILQSCLDNYLKHCTHWWTLTTWHVLPSGLPEYRWLYSRHGDLYNAWKPRLSFWFMPKLFRNNLRNNDSNFTNNHYNDVIMGATTSQITSLAIIYSTVYSGTDQRKHQSSASLAFVWVIHRGPVNSPHKWPVTRKVFPFDDVIMMTQFAHIYQSLCCRCTYYKYSNSNTIKALRLRCCYHVSLHKIYMKSLYQSHWTEATGNIPATFCHPMCVIPLNWDYFMRNS